MVSVAVSVQWLLSISELLKFPARVALCGSSFKMIYFKLLQHSHYRLRKYAFLPCQMVMGIDGFFSEKDRKLLCFFFLHKSCLPTQLFSHLPAKKDFSEVSPYLSPKEVAIF